MRGADEQPGQSKSSLRERSISLRQAREAKINQLDPVWR
jgi:hypothetical protein